MRRFKVYRVLDLEMTMDLIGQQVGCPECGAVFTIPELHPPEPSPPPSPARKTEDGKIVINRSNIRTIKAQAARVREKSEIARRESEFFAPEKQAADAGGPRGPRAHGDFGDLVFCGLFFWVYFLLPAHSVFPGPLCRDQRNLQRIAFPVVSPATQRPANFMCFAMAGVPYSLRRTCADMRSTAAAPMASGYGSIPLQPGVSSANR